MRCDVSRAKGEVIAVARLWGRWKNDAYAGEHGAARKHLQDVANWLRNDPTGEACQEAAAILERIAASGPPGWASAGLAPAHRPRNAEREYAISSAVEDLIYRGTSPGMARERIAQRNGLSVSRVKAIHLKWQRMEREARAAVSD